ncbi:MAG: PLP-dependent aminotransferase family protein, partial [Ktedonobacteraceae bacterium]|nr:PLP-dependent aminotransferase family protein [Ktedonobacteraceae bacterium]
EFHRRGYFASYLESLKQLYAPRLQAIVSALRKHLPDVPFAEPQGGFFISVTLPGARDLLRRAREVGLTLSDGRAFFADPIDASAELPGESFVRLPFCALTEEQIEEGVRRLAELV